MQFAPVANLPMYWNLLERGILGNYHLLIATEVVKDWWAWSNFWSPLAPDYNDDRFIIMDNGLIETGVPTDPQTLLEAAEAVQADCIVLPDVLGNYSKTRKVAAAAIPELRDSGVDLLGVVQGQNWAEIDDICLFYAQAGVKYVSVPRVMVEIFGTRMSVIHRVRSATGNLPIHLLGFSNNIYDDMLSACQKGVMGIDSAVPLWYPGTLPPMPPTDGDFGKRPEGYWQMNPDLPNYDNVERVRAWLRSVQVVLTAVKPQGPAETPELPFA